MNYSILYDNIIEKARFENRSKRNDIYYENHHIIPKCFGGSNKKDNLVLLTAKEHYICHKLLVELYNCYCNKFNGYRKRDVEYYKEYLIPRCNAYNEKIELFYFL